METLLKLPVGIEDFQEIRESGFCYIDKTKLIEQLLGNWGKVNLFTRPCRFDEQFGFTEKEVRRLLETYHLESHFSETKEWYDGYHFGNADIYCPWDVVNHVDRLKHEPGAKPQSYWLNSSGNGLVKRFISKANKTTRDEIERLVAGEAIEKSVRLELTYDEIDNSIDNLWSII